MMPTLTSSLPHTSQDCKSLPVEICITSQDWQATEGDFELALLSALERVGQAQWRMVCPNIFVERVEPYRTLVLRTEVLHALREQQQLFGQQPNGDPSTPDDAPSFHLSAELYSPLTGAGQAKINL